MVGRGRYKATAVLFRNRKHDVRWHLAGAINTLGCSNVIGSGRVVDAGQELLRIAVDHGKPSRLHLDHHAMSFEEDVIVIPQRDVPLHWLIRDQRLRGLEAASITSPPDFHGDG